MEDIMKKTEEIRKEQDEIMKACRVDSTENLFVQLVRHWNHCIMIKDELYERGWTITYIEDEIPQTKGGIF
jgi:hypothetical protein